MQLPKQRLGSTRSGKLIRYHMNDDVDELANLTKNYRSEDHFDAYVLFQFVLSLTTIFYAVNFGKSRADPIFHD